MNSQSFAVYRHSGKFGIHGPLLALLAAAAVGFPLGYAYAYIIKWIPFIYINFFLTIGYGFVFGFVTGLLLKIGKVRNGTIACLTGLLVAIIAMFFNWNAHIHTIFKDAPALCSVRQIIFGMKALYENGSWGLRSSGAVTGIPLAIVWGIEAIIIVGIVTLTSYVAIAEVPFCEQNQCWLDEEKKIEKMAAFGNPQHIAAFAANDLSPLTSALPRTPEMQTFARLTLKRSPKCDLFCTVRVENVKQELNSKGETKETVEKLTTGDLMLPSHMFDLLQKFDSFNQPAVQV
jgi:hypothetical protein